MLSRYTKLGSQIIDLCFCTRETLLPAHSSCLPRALQPIAECPESSGDNKPINTFTFLFSSIRRRMYEFRVCAGLDGTEVLKREICRRFCRSLGSWHRPSTLASNRLTPGKTPQRELSSGATLSASACGKPSHMLYLQATPGRRRGPPNFISLASSDPTFRRRIRACIDRVEHCSEA